MSRLSINKEALHFLPLGGCGEIGMNLNLYHCQGKWLMVDLGVSFETIPGVNVLMPDIKGFLPYKKDLVGLVLTHAHEDHIGAVPYLWPQLRCPIYATPFTADLVRQKLKEWGIRATVQEISTGGNITLGPFAVTFISLTHSIPEANALAIRTPLGTVLHTGDWKLDPSPVVGSKTDEQALQQLGHEGILALVCDSTNVFEEKCSGSETAVRDSLINLVGQCPQGRVAVACFASNIARLSICAQAAKAHGRQVVLAGRSLERMDQAARRLGYLEGYPPFLTEKQAAPLPRDKILLVCTGSQGESRAALARIAAKTHPNLHLEAGDTVIFSSRVIPGNEKSIFALQNQLARQEIQVLTHNEVDFIHVSGHPSQEELIQMYEWIKPQAVIPVHGEDRHLVAHANLAKTRGISKTFAPRNGQVLCLSSPDITVVGEVVTGRLGLDGKQLIPWKGLVIRDRTRLMEGGFIQITLILTPSGGLQDMQISLWGVVESQDMDKTLSGLEKIVEKNLNNLTAADRQNDGLIATTFVQASRRFIFQQRGKKPVVNVQVFRID